MLSQGLVAAWGFNKDLAELAGQYKDYIAGLVLASNDGLDHPAAAAKLGAGAYQGANAAARKLLTVVPTNLWASAGSMAIWWRGENLTTATDKIVELSPALGTGVDLFLSRVMNATTHRVGWMFGAVNSGLYLTLPVRDTAWHCSIVVWSDPVYSAGDWLWSYSQWHDGVGGADGTISVASETEEFPVEMTQFDLCACGNAAYWAGDVDALHIWQRALSPAEVAEVYAAGAGWEYSPTPPDSTPDAFDFTPITDADLSTLYTSEAVAITGMEAGTAVSITGGEYRVAGGAWTSAPGTINPGQTLELRATSAATPETVVTVSVTVGTVSVTWTITTAAVAAVVTNILLGSTADSSRVLNSRIVRGPL